MAKPVLKFTAVAYDVNGYTGYRPQLEQQKPVSDLDFCREVVTEKRLAMSAEELLHALEMVGEATVTKADEGLIRLTLAQSGGAMMAEKLRFTVTTPGGSAVKVLESFT